MAKRTSFIVVILAVALGCYFRFGREQSPSTLTMSVAQLGFVVLWRDGAVHAVDLATRTSTELSWPFASDSKTKKMRVSPSGRLVIFVHDSDTRESLYLHDVRSEETTSLRLDCSQIEQLSWADSETFSVLCTSGDLYLLRWRDQKTETVAKTSVPEEYEGFLNRPFCTTEYMGILGYEAIWRYEVASDRWTLHPIEHDGVHAYLGDTSLYYLLGLNTIMKSTSLGTEQSLALEVEYGKQVYAIGFLVRRDGKYLIYPGELNLASRNDDWALVDLATGTKTQLGRLGRLGHTVGWVLPGNPDYAPLADKQLNE